MYLHTKYLDIKIKRRRKNAHTDVADITIKVEAVLEDG
jgi:hypothetical protein